MRVSYKFNSFKKLHGLFAKQVKTFIIKIY